MNKKLLALLLVTAVTVAIAKNRIEIVEEKNLGLTKEMIEQDKRNAEQQESKGYYEEESDYPKFLLGAKERSRSEIRNYKNNKDAEDTHFKGSLSEVKLGWNYKGIKKNVIGYAAVGGYTEKGWSALKQIFEEKDIGMCEYIITNMELTDGSVRSSKDDARYDINNKLSSIAVSGNKHQGFIYNIYWYDNTFAHQLSCANQKFDRKITDGVIGLAREIDRG